MYKLFSILAPKSGTDICIQEFGGCCVYISIQNVGVGLADLVDIIPLSKPCLAHIHNISFIKMQINRFLPPVHTF